jgi:hypothetical protein
MPHLICKTCGTQHAEGDQPPAACAICQDERQYVKATGQNWTTLDKLRLANRNSLKFKEPGLIGVGIDPQFAIGQRALFLRTPKANVLCDCLPLLDEAVVEAIKALGGISGTFCAAPSPGVCGPRGPEPPRPVVANRCCGRRWAFCLSERSSSSTGLPVSWMGTRTSNEGGE